MYWGRRELKEKFEISRKYSKFIFSSFNSIRFEQKTAIKIAHKRQYSLYSRRTTTVQYKWLRQMKRQRTPTTDGHRMRQHPMQTQYVCARVWQEQIMRERERQLDHTKW